MNRDQHYAYSLVELLVTLTILVVLMAVAVPGFTSHVQRTRQNTHVDEMLAALYFSRGEAVTRRTTISLCDDMKKCSSKRWRGQLVVFVDSNQNGRLDESETILRTMQITPPYSWHWSNFRSQNHIAFKSNGMTNSLNGTFTLCREDAAERAIVINVAGRAKLESPPADNRCE